MILRRSKLSYVIFGLVGVVFLSATILSHSISSTYAHENTLNINVSDACTLSSGGGSYSVTMVDGSTEINANNITTSCNDTSGYAIYAVGYSGDSDTGNNTDLINTANSTYNIKTDGSSDTGSNWKLKFTVVSDATIAGSYNTYQNIPSTYTKVASYTNSTASGIITPHYQINLTGIQQPGTYVGQVKYVLVHPNTMSPTYTINYNANGGSGTMTSSTPSSFESFTLPTSTLTAPTGYAFKNWCTVQDQTQTPQTTCSGTTYTDGNTILANTIASGNTLNIYAVWSEIPKIYMQDLTLATCPTTITTVYDKRDGTPYRVQKLADNKCWMLDNLALDLTALTQAQLYGTGDNAGKMTNASNEALGYLKGATTGTSSDQWAMAAVKKTWTSSYSYSQPWIAVDSTTSGGCNNAYCVDGGAAGSPWSYGSVTSETINGVTSIAQGKIGVYYNYCAASAGSYCYGNGTSNTGSPSSDPNTSSLRDITDDICPYKWRLPTGGSTGEFQYLYSQYSGGSPSQVAAFQTALSTPLSGYFYSGKAYHQGNYGIFWSSTWYTTYYMYLLSVNSSNVYPSDYYNHYFGTSVRCILAE